MIHAVRLPNGNLINGAFDDKGTFLPGAIRRTTPRMQRIKGNLEFIVKRIKEINELRLFIQQMNLRFERYDFDVQRGM